MRKLPRATYAIQRMTLYGKLRQSNSDEAQYGESRYVVYPRGVFSSCMFHLGVWRYLP